MRSLISALGLALILAACGGSGSSNNSSGSGNGNGGGSQPPANPCTTAGATEVQAVGSVAGGAPAPDKTRLVDGNPRGRLGEALWIHQEAEQRRASGRIRPSGAPQPSAVSPAAAGDQDVGNIAVLQDAGDLVLPANVWDLSNTGLRFTRSGGSYTVSKIDATFRSTLGNAVTLGDDDSAEVDVPFPFPFYGASQTAAFVNSDGNITFGEEDRASTERNVSRLLSGAPRVAPFLSDLDPTSGGKVFVNAAPDQYTVTWCGVRGFGSTKTTTAQATLLPDGSVEMKFGTVTITDAVVGISPGHTGDFTTDDLGTASATGAGAIGERFASSGTLDTEAIARRFYQAHPDNYDQILIWTDAITIRDAFSYELTVENEIKGIGNDIYDLSSTFGSAGRLRSIVVMDFVGKFPADPNTVFLGENNTLSVMGQEVGHRWLAYLNFRDHTGTRSDALLGRDLAHWSFFFNSDASVMEGNQIQDLGGGQFKTVDAVKRYSMLDQYAMGLVPASAVPTFFYVENPVSNHTRADAPQIGVTFTGTRRDVLIDDVIAVEGDRQPGPGTLPAQHRQAFIYIVSNGQSLDQSQVTKLEGIRTAWTAFLPQATDQRMIAITTLK